MVLPAIKEEQVFRSISSKIEELEREHSRPGWTIWLIGSALLATALLFLDSWEKFRGSWQVVGAFSVAFYLISHVVLSFLLSFRSRFAQGKHPRIKYSTTLYRSAKRIICLEFVYSVLVLYLLNVIIVPPWIRALGNVIVSVFVLFIVFSLILTFVRYPLVITAQKKKRGLTYALNAVFGVIPTVIGVGIFLPYIDSITQNIAEIRMAALIVTAVILFGRAVNLSKRNPLLLSLMDLRSDLVFNALNPSEASERLELIVIGFRLEQAVDVELSAVLRVIHEATATWERIYRHFHLFESPPAGLSEGEVSDIKNAAVDAMCRCTNESENILELLKTAVDRLYQKLAIIRKQCQDPMEVDQLIVEVRKEFGIMTVSFNSFRKKFEKHCESAGVIMLDNH